MACERIGLVYLDKKEDFLDKIWEIGSNVRFRKITLAILQKFSLKKKNCLRMIELGVGDWLLEVLDLKSESNRVTHITSYELQYGFALMMNLSFLQSGQRRFE